MKKVNLIILILILFIISSIPLVSKSLLPPYLSLIPKDSMFGVRIDSNSMMKKSLTSELLKFKAVYRINSFIKYFEKKTGLDLKKDKVDFWFFSTVPETRNRKVIIASADSKYKPLDAIKFKNTKKGNYNANLVGDGTMLFARNISLFDELHISGKPENKNFSEIFFSNADISFALITDESIRNYFKKDSQKFMLSMISKLKGSLNVGENGIDINLILTPLHKNLKKSLVDGLKGVVQVYRMILSQLDMGFVVDQIKIGEIENQVVIFASYDLKMLRKIESPIETKIAPKNPEHVVNGTDLNFIFESLESKKANDSSVNEPTKEELEALFNDIKKENINVDRFKKKTK